MVKSWADLLGSWKFYQDVSRYRRRKRTYKNCLVKIRCVTNNFKEKHADGNFTFTAKEYLKNIASIVGQDSVLVLSIDDKAKIPIGITAATKQVPMVMYMTYEIRLPDHNFLVATSHKLAPSVYPACEITRCSIKSDFIIP